MVNVLFKTQLASVEEYIWFHIIKKTGSQIVLYVTLPNGVSGLFPSTSLKCSTLLSVQHRIKNVQSSNHGTSEEVYTVRTFLSIKESLFLI